MSTGEFNKYICANSYKYDYDKFGKSNDNYI